ncbi:oxidoreductase [Streptomyces piniterrae]|uniref:Oxidoreductase n=1 Tax=Streptomyces piniterrae TaxID=2571125 RepID=A0A4U0NR04_9ACTN|nr:oxidoreductase [Streptomyces piniterrae]TJZ56907.1 oxidoreductase [Streptomyces piniterrae]
MSAESAEYATFGLAPAMRPGGVLPTGAYQMHRDFLDFSIDGRPLLLRLADLDAVSPLAADLGPSLLAAQVRRLLLEDGPPLDGGRRVIYGCPECEGPACGAVTAVIERDGPDFVWRDFAWQTDDTVDLRLNGYTGLGPFRFEGVQYRAVLERLLESDAESPERPARRVLLVGRRAAVLTKLAAALRGTGIGAEITHDAAGAAPDELRSYGAVALGRGVDEAERAAVRQAFADAGSTAVLVDGLAPIVPLLVAQIEEALDRCPQDERRLLRLVAERDGDTLTATLTVAIPCRVRLTGYRLDRLYRTRTTELFDGQLAAGEHELAVDGLAGEAFVVARTTGGVLVARVGR